MLVHNQAALDLSLRGFWRGSSCKCIFLVRDQAACVRHSFLIVLSRTILPGKKVSSHAAEWDTLKGWDKVRCC